MSVTPVPRAPGTILFVCDHCHKTVEVSEYVTLPAGWWTVELEEWVGAFHLCSKECADAFDPGIES